MKSLIILGVCIAALAMAACDYTPTSPTSEEKQNATQEQANLQAVQQVGFPAITNYAEKRLLKEIYELRDGQLRTYAYTQDMNGKYHKLCDSIGYGIPYDTEFTNPQQAINGNTTGAEPVIPQADPNGLYSGQTAGTWVECHVPGTDKNTPVYVEPNVIVSPFPLVQD